MCDQIETLKLEFCDYCVSQMEQQENHLTYTEWLETQLINQRQYTLELINSSVVNGLGGALIALSIAARLYVGLNRSNSMREFCCDHARGVVTLSEAISFYKANR